MPIKQMTHDERRDRMTQPTPAQQAETKVLDEEFMAENCEKWDRALADAKAELSQVERRRSQLLRAIRSFEASKRDGVPWPVANETSGNVCEVLIGKHGAPTGPICGKPAVLRYPAHGGGFMYLCEAHGAKHLAYCDRWNGAIWGSPADPREDK